MGQRRLGVPECGAPLQRGASQARPSGSPLRTRCEQRGMCLGVKSRRAHASSMEITQTQRNLVGRRMHGWTCVRRCASLQLSPSDAIS